jgi:hypothetical protein
MARRGDGLANFDRTARINRNLRLMWEEREDPTPQFLKTNAGGSNGNFGYSAIILRTVAARAPPN